MRAGSEARAAGEAASATDGLRGAGRPAACRRGARGCYHLRHRRGFRAWRERPRREGRLGQAGRRSAAGAHWDSPPPPFPRFGSCAPRLHRLVARALKGGPPHNRRVKASRLCGRTTRTSRATDHDQVTFPGQRQRADRDAVRVRLSYSEESQRRGCPPRRAKADRAAGRREPAVAGGADRTPRRVKADRPADASGSLRDGAKGSPLRPGDGSEGGR